MNDRAHAGDDWFPLDPQEHALQLDALAVLLEETPNPRLLDLGSGDGRIAKPLTHEGVRVLAIDQDEAALQACEAGGAMTRRGDLLDPHLDLLFPDGSRAHAAACLGNTFMELHDPIAAAALLRRVRSALSDGGWLAIDNICESAWADVAEGNWQTGVSEDGQWQLLWAPGDNVVSIRRGDAVEPDDWEIGPRDRLLRLWSMGELALLAHATGWTAPAVDPTGTLILFRKA